MPHYILGLGWDEIASIVTVLTAVFGALTAWLVHTVNSNFRKNAKPLNDSLEKLSEVIHELQFHLDEHSKNISNVADDVRKISERVVQHEARIQVLEDKKKEDDD